MVTEWQEFLSYKNKDHDRIAQVRYLQENVNNWAAATKLKDNIDLRTLNNFQIYIQGGRLNREYLKIENRVRLAGLVDSFWKLAAFTMPDPVVFLYATLMTGDPAPLGYLDCQINDSRVAYLFN